jgi:Big-like domain-containing protein
MKSHMNAVCTFMFTSPRLAEISAIRHSFLGGAPRAALSVLILALFAFPVRSASTVFVPLGATWSYLDDGSNQGTAWSQPDFDDTAWLSGCAQLGYGDGDECKVVGYGPDLNNKYITTYFRHQFQVTNAAQFIGLSVQLLADDGAVIYLNGTEVFRSRMPDGPITFNTFAASSGNDAIYVFSVFCANSLVEGTNVLAVEVHQISPNSSDISFDFKLEGLDVITPAVHLAQPAEASRFAAGANILLAASAMEPCGAIRAVEFYEGSNKIGEALAAPFELTWPNVPVGNYSIQAVATNEFGTGATSAPVHIRVLVPENSVLIPAQANWKYLDDGSDQSNAWRELAFDDSGWSNGVAELGYGDAADGYPEATVLGYGPDPNDKYITTYFRHTFNVTNSEFHPNLILRVLRDDGVVVFLNGAEIFRNNMPQSEPIDYRTLALEDITGADETNWIESCLVPTMLVNGDNVLAAEIHQFSPQSPDISFDLELLTGPVAGAELTITRSGENVLICWPRRPDCYALQTTDSLNPPALWLPVNAPVTPSEQQNCVSLPISQTAAFYRLKLR